VVPKETNSSLVFRATSPPYAGQITVETLLKPLFSDSPFASKVNTFRATDSF
jgi:hypothetical protein